MAKILRLREIHSIKVGPASTLLPDGTIVNPVPYDAVDIEFDDGVSVQVERPLTPEKVTEARKQAKKQSVSIDGVAEGVNFA